MQVDSHADNAASYKVAKDENGVPLSIYLNWSDLKANHNKFYIAQVLVTNSLFGNNSVGYVYTRYGRVGVTGVKSCHGMDFDKAVREYCKVTRAKQRKGYTEIKMAGGKDKDQAAGGAVGVSTKAAITVSTNESFAKSALPDSVQTLMKFFFDKSLMETSMVSVNVDVRRMPLG